MLRSSPNRPSQAWSTWARGPPFWPCRTREAWLPAWAAAGLLRAHCPAAGHSSTALAQQKPEAVEDVRKVPVLDAELADPRQLVLGH